MWSIAEPPAVLTKYMPKTKVRKVKNLLSGPDETETEAEEVCFTWADRVG